MRIAAQYKSGPRSSRTPANFTSEQFHGTGVLLVPPSTVCSSSCGGMSGAVLRYSIPPLPRLRHVLQVPVPGERASGLSGPFGASISVYLPHSPSVVMQRRHATRVKPPASTIRLMWLPAIRRLTATSLGLTCSVSESLDARSLIITGRYSGHIHLDQKTWQLKVRALSASLHMHAFTAALMPQPRATYKSITVSKANRSRHLLTWCNNRYRTSDTIRSFKQPRQHGQHAYIRDLKASLSVPHGRHGWVYISSDIHAHQLPNLSCFVTAGIMAVSNTPARASWSRSRYPCNQLTSMPQPGTWIATGPGCDAALRNIPGC